MHSPTYQPVLHRWAVLTAVVALLPIVVGAIVTTLDAGMAFRDWPSSDGWFLLTYPWLADLMGGAVKKFVEHGHRLAGALIGLVSIGLAVVFSRNERRRFARNMALAVLAAVILQGLLGGGRVLLDRRVLAMVHGVFAALVFSLMGCLVLATSRRWIGWKAAQSARPRSPGLQTPIALAVPVVVFVQFLLGGMLRHLKTAVLEHVVFAGVVLTLVIAAAVAAHASGNRELARSSRWPLALGLVQAALGVAAWLSTFGYAPLGYVAVVGSTAHIAFRTVHTVAGMLLLLAGVVHAVWAVRIGRHATAPRGGQIGELPLAQGERLVTGVALAAAKGGAV